MVLEVHVLLCVTEPDFFCPQNGENGPKTGFLEFIQKFSHYFFSEFGLQRKVTLFAVSLH